MDICGEKLIFNPFIAFRNDFMIYAIQAFAIVPSKESQVETAVNVHR